MKPILVLAPAQPGAPLRERQVVDVYRGMPESLEPFSTVVVVDDGGAGSARRLFEALSARDTLHDPRIGLLSFLADGAGPLQCDPFRAGDRIRRPSRLRLGGNLEVPSIEYQIV